MPSFFQTGVTGSFGLYTGIYLWSNTSNWVGGVQPANGGIATFSVSTSLGNPTGVDDIASLYLDTLHMPQGYLAVVGTLEIGTINLGISGGDIFASTIAGNAAAALTIDGLSGSSGIIIGASGAGAVTTIAALADVGETYVADEAGEIVMNPAPNASSTFEYGNAPGGFITTFAFRNPGAAVTAALANVTTGDAIALPGSSVSSVSFVDNTGNSLNGTLSIVTNLGTTTFNHVSYVGNVTPGGYTVSTDPTGLQRIVFTTPPTSVFQTGATGLFGLYTGIYLWSNTANWVGGAKPANGGIATFSVSTSLGNPTGVDDIASLYLDTLHMPQGYLAVVGTLEIGTINLGISGGDIFASTIAGNAAAALTIDGLSGSSGIIIGASGAGAVTTIAALADVGETYVADEAGEIVMNPAPNASSTFEYGNAPGGFITTFAFRNPGAAVTAALANVTTGDAIALPGSSVSSVSFVDNTGNSLNGTLSIVTNLGTTTFNHVSYVGNVTPGGYTVSTDPTGLQRITLACYAAGTRIGTPRGEVPVEQLRVGEAVCLARGGTAPVRWLGHRRIDLLRQPQPRDLGPIRVRAHAFATNVPKRDLLLSPDHAVFVDGVLIPVRCLANGLTITQEAPPEITYWHVELDGHDVILADGLACESYLDTGNRSAFANTGAIALRRGFVTASASAYREVHACATLLVSGEIVRRTRTMLRTRAIGLGTDGRVLASRYRAAA